MNLPASEENARAQLRQGVYLLLIVASAGAMTARIMAVNAVDKLALDKYRIAQQLKKDRAKYESEGLSGDDFAAIMKTFRPGEGFDEGRFTSRLNGAAEWYVGISTASAGDSPELSNPASLAGSIGNSRVGRMSTPVRSWIV